MRLDDEVARLNQEEYLKEKRQRDRSANNKQYLILMAKQAGYGDNVEGYIESLKSGQKDLEPIGFWDFPDPQDSLGTTEDELNPKHRTQIKSKITGKVINTSKWPAAFNPKNRGEKKHK